MHRRSWAGAVALAVMSTASLAACATVIGLDQVQRVDCVADCGVDGSALPDGSFADRSSVDAPAADAAPPLPDGAEAGPCARDSDCVDPNNPRCDVPSGRCVPCLPQNDNCPTGRVCTATNGSYACVQGCQTASMCAALDGGTGEGGALVVACCNNLCTNASFDDMNCGACGVACGATASSCCSATCVDGQTDPAHCGGCANRCSASHMASVTCTQATCDGMCSAGFADCNNNKLADGCEANLGTDPGHCGGCGNVCSPSNMATVTCAAGTCNGTCDPGFADCNNNKLFDGCEANLATDPGACGACGKVCSGNNIAAPSCASSTCNGACNPGFADCNNDKLTDGCETSVSGNASDCGACGDVCSSNHMATTTCASGVCSGTCDPGFADCNNNKLTDGCEVDTKTDPKNCGGCGVVCGAAMPDCNNGVCTTLYTFPGVQSNLPAANLVGWTKCFSDDFGTTLPATPSILAGCPGSHLLMACAPTASQATLTIAAMGLTSDVTFVTGNTAAGQNKVHTANGVEWYFDNNWSWGFAPAGDAVTLNECDTNTTPDGPLRLCWHTLTTVGGYRCGATTAINGPAATGWTRLLYSAP